MTDDELIAAAQVLRREILEGRPSDGMCGTVSFVLQGYLAACGEHCHIVAGEVDVEGVAWCNHVWLRLRDGRVLDPTVDQFNATFGKSWPPVYLGKPIPEVHRARLRMVPDERGTTMLKLALAP